MSAPNLIEGMIYERLCNGKLYVLADLKSTHGWLYLLDSNRCLHLSHKTILKRYKPRPDLMSRLTTRMA
jgi:hypothetical protein